MWARLLCMLYESVYAIDFAGISFVLPETTALIELFPSLRAYVLHSLYIYLSTMNVCSVERLMPLV